MGEAAVTYDPVGQERQRIGYSHLIIAMESDLVNDESSFVAVESQLEVKLCFHPWKAKQCGKGRGHVGWQWVQNIIFSRPFGTTVGILDVAESSSVIEKSRFED